MSLCKLPDEILLIIFNYCDAHDLTQLNCVCKRFYDIASEILIKESNYLLITSQKSDKFRERCQPFLFLYREKFSIHNNWKHGRYKCKIFCPKFVSNIHSLRYCVWEECRNRLEMRKDVILFLNGNSNGNLCAYNRTKNGLVSDDNVIVAKCSTETMDIYVPRNDIIVTYHRDGSIRQWTIDSLDGKKYFNEKLLCSAYSNHFWLDPYTIDVTSQNIVIGSNADREITIWKYIPEENSIKDKYIIPDLNLNRTLEPYIHFITFNPIGTKFVAGITHAMEDERFIIYDINNCCTEGYIKLNDLDSDLLDYTDYTLWKEPNDFLFLNYGRIIKMDVRTHKVVQKWNAPLDLEEHYNFIWETYSEQLTCMSTDNQYAIMTGTSNGKLILWDQRKSDFIQVYDKENVGYVECLKFDSSHMYVAADKIFEFDFT